MKMIDSENPLEPYFKRLNNCSTGRWTGRVVKAVGNVVESEGPYCSIGECCVLVGSNGERCDGEVIGFRGSSVLSVPLRPPETMRFGDAVITWGERPSLRVGEGMLGRVIDAVGNPLDEKPSYGARQLWPLRQDSPLPLDRIPITEPLGCGVRAIDGFITCGRGQRLGIFGGSGVGKSTLIGMMTRGSAADVIVLALIGERGREVRQFLEESLGGASRDRSVVMVSTSDQSPLLRIRAALGATAIAEYFRSRGKHVLLVVDSLTRLAMAQREIGLAAGEPPTSKGYTPSVFTLLSHIVERAGSLANGSITGFYTVLMEGDDQQDPLVDAVRSLLDGHIVLDRRLAIQNHYPPINILDSLSRLMPSVCMPGQLEKAERLRALLAAYSNSEDMIRIGAYQKNLDPMLDRAISAMPFINTFLCQKPTEQPSYNDVVRTLLAIPE